MQFSVVIPVYNKRPHVARAISSVLNQELEDFELIIVDDASTDGSWNEVTRFSDPRIVHLRRESPGPGGYAARNLGIQKAHAAWIAFLDADDQWNRRHLETIRALRERYSDCGCLCTHYENNERTGHRWEARYGTINKHRGPHRIGYVSYLRHTRKNASPLWTSVTVARKALLQRVGGFPEGRCRTGGDVDLWLRIAAVTPIAWSPYVGAAYYRDSVNMVTSVPGTSLTKCVDNTIRQLLHDSQARYSPTLQLELRRVWNHYRRKTTRNRLYAGGLRVSDLRHLSFWGNPLLYSGLALLAVVPGAVVRRCIQIVKSSVRTRMRPG